MSPAVTFSSEINNTRATIDAGALLSRLEDEAIAFLESAYRRGLTGEQIAAELEVFLSELSDKPVGQLARKSTTVAFNMGRDDEIKSRAEEIAFVVRTEILDSATCGPCAGLDGTSYQVGTDAYEENMPPNKCDGGDRCRGFYVPVSNGN